MISRGPDGQSLAPANVVLHVANHRKNASNLDEDPG